MRTVCSISSLPRGAFATIEYSTTPNLSMLTPRRLICLPPGMVTYRSFTALDGTHQLDVLGDEGVFLAERACGGAYSLYYMVNSFYVEIRLDPRTPAEITFRSFTPDDPQFDEQVEALPVDPCRLLYASR